MNEAASNAQLETVNRYSGQTKWTDTVDIYSGQIQWNHDHRHGQVMNMLLIIQFNNLFVIKYILYLSIYKYKYI